MNVTKNPSYKTKIGSGDAEYKLELEPCRFYGVIAKPFICATVMSPEELTNRQSDYTTLQQSELNWRTGEWRGKPTVPPPEFADAISLHISGEARLTTKRIINLIEDDGSNSRYDGKVTLSISEGDPTLSRMLASPAYNVDDERVDEALNFHIYISRPQLEALFIELRGTGAGLAFRLDAWGFMFGPERSFATFQQTQHYYLERTAIIREFSVSTHCQGEIAEGLNENVTPEALGNRESAAGSDGVPDSEPVPAPIDYRSELRTLARGIATLVVISGLTLVLLLLRTCGGH